jgi:hypothetical protein
LGSVGLSVRKGSMYQLGEVLSFFKLSPPDSDHRLDQNPPVLWGLRNWISSVGSNEPALLDILLERIEESGDEDGAPCPQLLNDNRRRKPESPVNWGTSRGSKAEPLDGPYEAEYEGECLWAACFGLV